MSYNLVAQDNQLLKTGGVIEVDTVLSTASDNAISNSTFARKTCDLSEQVNKTILNNIPISEEEDNIIQLKKDGIYAEFTGVSNDINYSLDEQVIALYDNKPVYKKTLEYTSLTRHQYGSTISHNIANIEQILDYDAVCINSNNTTRHSPWYYTSNNNFLVEYVTPTQFHLKNNGVTGTTMYLTIIYTKTTD